MSTQVRRAVFGFCPQSTLGESNTGIYTYRLFCSYPARGLELGHCPLGDGRLGLGFARPLRVSPRGLLPWVWLSQSEAMISPSSLGALSHVCTPSMPCRMYRYEVDTTPLKAHKILLSIWQLTPLGVLQLGGGDSGPRVCYPGAPWRLGLT